MITKIFFISLLFATISIQAQTAGGPHNYVKQQFDILEYNPVIVIENPSSKIINGINNITLEWEKPSLDNKFYFHNEDLTIDSVFYDGERVIFDEVVEQDPTNVYLSVSATNTNKIGMVQIYYSGKMTSEGGNYNWGGVHYSQGILYAMGVGFFNEYVSCTRHWMPCFDLPSDKAKYKGTFIVPDSLMAISNGKLLSKTDTLDTFTKYTWSMGDAVAATYLLTFAVGKFSEVQIDSDGKPVTIYMYDDVDSKSAGEAAFRLVPEMIETFENLFNYEYPFETMAYYAASRGAMEHQGLVTMSESQIRTTAYNKDSLYITAAHELAHQWFGNLVTPYDFKDAWLNEGLASYAEYLWIKEKRFLTAYHDELLKLRADYINNVSVPEQHIPLYNFHRFSKNNYPSTIYKKGALVMALLHNMVGDEVFYSKMNEYLTTYENGNVTTEDLRNTFGIKVPDKFWDDWVYGRGYPLLDVKSYQTNDTVVVIVEQQENEFGVYDFDFNYLIKSNLNNEYVQHKVDSKIDTMKIIFEEKYNEIEIDDRNLYLYKVMSNNNLTSVENDYKDEVNLVGTDVGDNLEIDFDKAGNYSIEIVTLNGEKVLIEKGDYSSRTSFDISGLAAGVYFVYISSDEYTTIKKIMVR